MTQAQLNHNVDPSNLYRAKLYRVYSDEIVYPDPSQGWENESPIPEEEIISQRQHQVNFSHPSEPIKKATWAETVQFLSVRSLVAPFPDQKYVGAYQHAMQQYLRGSHGAPSLPETGVTDLVTERAKQTAEELRRDIKQAQTRRFLNDVYPTAPIELPPKRVWEEVTSLEGEPDERTAPASDSSDGSSSTPQQTLSSF